MFKKATAFLSDGVQPLIIISTNSTFYEQKLSRVLFDKRYAFPYNLFIGLYRHSTHSIRAASMSAAALFSTSRTCPQVRAVVLL